MLNDPPPPRVTEVDARTDSRYGLFVASHPDAVVFHHPAWLQVLEREYGGRSLVLASEDGAGELNGVLPLFYTKGMPFGLGGIQGTRRLSSLPRTPVAGPLALNAAQTRELLRAARDRVAEPGLQLEIKSPQPLSPDATAGLTTVPWRVFYTLDLPAHPSDIRFGNSNRHSQIKRGVSKAVKQGLRSRLAESESELAEWYAIYARTMRRNGAMARSRRFFTAMWELLRPLGLMRLWLAKRDGRVVAGVLTLGCGRTEFYAFGGWQQISECAHANDLLHWEAIHEACRLGFRSYDFGEVPHGDAGLAQFKSKWNTRAVRLERYYFPALRRPPSRSSGANFHRLAKLMWQHMPGFAAERLSDWVYGYL